MSQNTSEAQRRGFMFILSSPSGAGKTTISRLLLENDDNLVMSVSVTTRDKRSNEVDGKDYHFISQDEFSKMVADDNLLECAEVFGNSYGTPEDVVDESLNDGVDVLFDIDWQGTQQLAKSRRDDVVSIFILPPSMQELESRLRGRGQDSEEIIQGRMAKAAGEISHWLAYDYVIVNNDIEDSLRDVQAILNAERKKRVRQHGLSDYIADLLK